ncbi:ribosome silencing factor [Moraxella catarrhalis]|uniref:ribosome silencing factor n=1 Tax=Moraxella catarrhalis TaxID=480 RepID=UPI000EAA8734|nr:ribosome silencing factor [Moraxella catarrhalis]MDE4518908.1 ribosome silencing factor [Moraxella catarrhalis]MPW81221.1 ribosome silencing factor [Moraxella catarrhalis]MPW89555.1 ribosome silencing factor [Moraxella catarrhalis]MPX23242.1 ribosome silencing factor [Moraxella catarrhalis]MPX35616.1 ribosome silencing factor [Moraxella catarrhalis]
MTTLNLDQTLTLVTKTLDDLKAKNITTLEIEHLTEIAERIVICEATSKRHVKALADKLGAATKEAGLMPLGREGDKDSDWTLVDLGAVVVHIMTPQARAFYDLEGLWSSPDALKALVAQRD